MKRAWQIACIAFLALSIFMIVLSFEYPYHDRLGPGPGFFPFWLSVITGALSLALFFQTTWARAWRMATASHLPRPPRICADHGHHGCIGGMPRSPRSSGLPYQSFPLPPFPPVRPWNAELVGYPDIRRSWQLRNFSCLLLLVESASTHGGFRDIRRRIWTRCNTGFRAFP